MQKQNLHKKVKTLTLLTISIVALLLGACKKDTICNDPTNPKCSNYDACYNKTEAKADFNILEVMNNGVYFYADTTYIYTQTTLKSLYNKGCSIKWHIKSPSHSFTLTDSIANINPTTITPTLTAFEMYTVTLVVTKDNGACNSVKAVDSVSKMFYLWGNPYSSPMPYKYLPIFGTYAGYKLSNPTQLVYVTLHDSAYTAPNLACNGGIAGNIYRFNIIRNLAYNNFSTENFSKAVGGLYYQYGGSCLIFDNNITEFYNSPLGCYGSKFLVYYGGLAWLDLKNSNKININYQYKDTVSYQWVADYFTGTRVN